MKINYHNELIDEITFKGLSTRLQRKLILLTTVCIVIGLTLAAIKAIKLIPENQMTQMLTFFLVSCLYVHHLLTQKFILKKLALAIVNLLPLTKLYNEDKRIVERAKSRMLPIAMSLRDSDLTIHKRINPRLDTTSVYEVIQHLHELERWTVCPENTKKCADFVYQYILVEQWLEQQEIEHSVCPFNQSIVERNR